MYPGQDGCQKTSWVQQEMGMLHITSCSCSNATVIFKTTEIFCNEIQLTQCIYLHMFAHGFFACIFCRPAIWKLRFRTLIYLYMLAWLLDTSREAYILTTYLSSVALYTNIRKSLIEEIWLVNFTQFSKRKVGMYNFM